MPNDRTPMPSQDDVIAWLRSRSDKEFVDLFSRAAAGRSLAPLGADEYESHLVIAHVSKDPELVGGWEIELLGVPEKSSEWAADALVAQQGSHCGHTVASYAKRFRCPLCGGEAFGT